MRQVEARPPSRWARLRGTIDSFGGFIVIGGIGGAVAVLIAVIVIFSPSSASEDPLLGETIHLGPATHVDPSTVAIAALPHAGGPHAPSPLRHGVYDEPISEPQAIHAMEHGVVWLTYQPEVLSAEDFARLEDVANDHARDVILSPRLENADPIVLVSWGQRLVMDTLDADLVGEFIRTNRNRSPEPGIR